ncbi:MAG: hypothetical protein ACFFAN_11820 [Promethearchaeota archaeon]
MSNVNKNNKDKQLNHFFTILTLFLGFELSIFFILRADINALNITIAYLAFNILINVLGILSTYLLFINPEKKHKNYEKFMQNCSQNLILLSFTGVFFILFYFICEYSIYFQADLLTSRFLQIIFIISIIVIISFLLFFYHLFNIIENRKISVIYLVFESVIWIGFYLTAFLWIFYLFSNHWLFLYCLITFLANFIYLTTANLEKEEGKKKKVENEDDKIEWSRILRYFFFVLLNGLALIFIIINTLNLIWSY